MTSDSNSYVTKKFTPLAAAKHTGYGRTTIMKAIKEHDLKATRDNRNRWNIASEDLEEWAKNRPATNASLSASVGVTDTTVMPTDAMLTLSREHAAAEATIVELRSQLAKNEERNAEEIRRQDRIIERQQETINRLTAPKAGLLRRIFSTS